MTPYKRKQIIGDCTLYLGDCLEIMPTLRNGCIDLILSDPPYEIINGMGKGEERYSIVSEVKWDNIINHAELLERCNQSLRMNGTLSLFSQEPFTSKIITEQHNNLPFSYRLIWLKDHYSNSLLVNKAPVSYVEDICLFFKKYDTLAQHPLRDYSRKIFNFIGEPLKRINTKMGHRKAEHFFYITSTQFDLCTVDVYNELIKKFNIDSCNEYIPYNELEIINKRFNRRFNRRFNLPDGQKYKSNVLQHRKDYSGLHPTQKPVSLIRDLIKTYSDAGEIVMDFAMGSGTTGVACIELGRKFTGIELDEKYFDIACERISRAERQGDLFRKPTGSQAVLFDEKGS